MDPQVQRLIENFSDESGGPWFRGALLFYGRFAHSETPSIKTWGDRDLILSRKVMDWFESHYLAGGGDPASRYIALLTGNLQGFPPSILVVGTLDPLQSDSEMFAAALREVGVEAELHVFEDGIHAFVQMPMLDMAREALERVSRFARRRIA